jgi:hypothetical protein
LRKGYNKREQYQPFKERAAAGVEAESCQGKDYGGQDTEDFEGVYPLFEERQGGKELTRAAPALNRLRNFVRGLTQI